MVKEKKENFRKYTLKSGLLVVAGKNASMNEEIIKQAGKNEYVLHTKLPGSPFCNIKSDYKVVSREDLYETAVFCAFFSQAWKKSSLKKDVDIHVFFGKDIYKSSEMKTGTFGVRKLKNIIAKKDDILNFRNA
jgi:predicted ribosome quality control (RQC) complex YloA/Tae2 family protein